MSNSCRYILIAALSCFLLSCQETRKEEEMEAVDVENAQNLIRQKVEDFMQAFRAKDSIALSTFYAADGWVLAPGQEPVLRDQNAAMWGNVFRMGLSELELSIHDISGNAGYLIETGQYKMFAGDQQVDQGNYLVVWKKEAKEWKMFRDIWNSSLPSR